MGRLLGLAGALSWWAGALVLAAWGLGQAFTDRWHWSQYCFWIPTVIAIPAAAALMVAGAGVRAIVRVKCARGAGGVGRAAVVASFAAVLGAAVYAAAWEWRLLSPRPTVGGGSLRVLHWNATSDIGRSWAARVMDESPDLIVINPASHQLCREIVSPGDPYEEPLYRHGFTVISRFRVLRTAYTTLRISQGSGFDPREEDLKGNHKDPGRAMMVELDTRELFGRTMTVLCLDLPSDISLHRAVSAAEAAKSLASFTGPFSVRGADGVWSLETPSEPGFAKPDLVLGDFNTPRGSWSLGLLTDGLSPVYADAGRGPFGTWPYRRPLWHLDQMFVSSWLRGTRYEPVDLGGGTHRAQIAEIAAREPS